MSEIVFSGKESDKTISTIIKFWGTFTPQDRIELDDINNLKTYKDNLAILSNWLLVDVVEMLKDKNEEPGSKLQTVIENLLTDMNFHEDCGEFIAGYYDNYLSL